MTDPAVYTVVIDPAAEADLRSIALYLDDNFSPAAADRFVTKTLDRIATLEHLPLRGSVPKELERVGSRKYRQLVSGPNRILYTVVEREVIVVLIADGRRDMDALLTERLLGL